MWISTYSCLSSFLFFSVYLKDVFLEQVFSINIMREPSTKVSNFFWFEIPRRVDGLVITIWSTLRRIDDEVVQFSWVCGAEVIEEISVVLSQKQFSDYLSEILKSRVKTFSIMYNVPCCHFKHWSIIWEHFLVLKFLCLISSSYAFIFLFIFLVSSCVGLFERSSVDGLSCLIVNATYSQQ